MINPFLTPAFAKNMLDSLVTSVIVLLVYAAIQLILKKRHRENTKHQKRIRARVFYITSVMYVIFIARIWITGFSNIFTVLGLVSAALVVTNKETIMNFVSWFIISWRGLFAEGDYIEIGEVSGYVRNIGALYFTLSSRKPKKNINGQLIKVPNGFVLTKQLINYSQADALYHKTISVIFTPESDYKVGRQAIINLLTKILKEETRAYYKKKLHEPLNKIDDMKLVSTLESFIKIRLEKPAGIVCECEFDCYFSHHHKIENEFWESWLELAPTLQNVKMAYGA